MGTDGIDSLKQALRRSLWILVLLPLLGLAALNAVRQSQGPLYEASAEVILSPNDIAASLTGIQQLVDPERVEDTEIALAESAQLFRRTANRANGELGDAAAVRDATSVEFANNTITFTASADDAEAARRIANAVAIEYPVWRAEVAGAALDRAIEQVRGEIAAGGQGTLVEQLNRLNVMKALTSGNVLLVERAATADKVRPRPLLDSLLGLLIGMFAALMAVGLREAIDTRVRSEDEIEQLLDTSVIGTVERLPRRSGVVALEPRRERYQDMYGLLAANLAQARTDEKPLVVAVTSASPSEGKTTTATNLAASFAQRNGRVLALDLDGRRPGIAGRFRIPKSSPGLESVLTEGTPVASAVWRVPLNGAQAVRSGEPSEGAPEDDDTSALYVVPLHEALPEVAVHHSARIASLLENLRGQVDYVVIDTPPALSSADMTELARMVDVVLVVVRHGRISRRTLASLAKLMRRWPNARTSAVLVDVPRQESPVFYYGRA